MTRFLLATLILILACQVLFAQQTNPVDRKVANPMTDTPTVNPLHTDQPLQRRPATQNGVTGTPTDEITVTSAALGICIASMVWVRAAGAGTGTAGSPRPAAIGQRRSTAR